MDPKLHPADVGTYAQRVEALGFDTLHVAEMVHDPFVTAALALSATEVLRVRTAVALAFVRSPMVTALSAWNLARLSAGRFDLGLGTQVRANVEERYGMPFAHPVERMGDHVDAVRACFGAFAADEPVRHEGPFITLTRLQPDFRPGPLESAPPPAVWLGAVGDRMVELAGRTGDGLVTHPTNSHPVDLEQRLLPALRRGAASADRRPPPVVVSPLVATGPDREAVSASVEALRPRLAFLYSTPAYRPTLEALDLGGLGESLHRLTREQRWDELPAMLPADLVAQLCPVATHDELPTALVERYSAGISGVVLRPPSDPADDHSFRPVVAALRAH